MQTYWDSFIEKNKGILYTKPLNEILEMFYKFLEEERVIL